MTRQQEGMEIVKPIPDEQLNQKLGGHDRWTEEQLEEFLKLYHQQITYREISLKIGRNMNSITNKIYALGLHRRRYNEWKEQEMALLIQMKLQKASVKKIAKKLNRTEKSVTKKINTLGLSKARK